MTFVNFLKLNGFSRGTETFREDIMTNGVEDFV